MIQKIKRHLETASGCPFKRIGMALDLAKVQESSPSIYPAAYVYPSGAIGEDDQRINDFQQVVLERFGVTFFLRAENDPTGGEKADQVETCFRWLRSALCGWVPDPSTGETIIFQRGYLVDFTQGGVWWAEEFVLKSYI